LDHDEDAGAAPGNAFDIEERLAAQRLIGGDDYPLYDSDDESTDQEELEAARRAGGLRHRVKVANHIMHTLGRQMINGLRYLTPFPRPTELPEGTSGRVRNMLKGQIQIKRFRAPKGKRE
jgi:DNA replication licensing factor MCM4